MGLGLLMAFNANRPVGMDPQNKMLISSQQFQRQQFDRFETLLIGQRTFPTLSSVLKM